MGVVKRQRPAGRGVRDTMARRWRRAEDRPGRRAGDFTTGARRGVRAGRSRGKHHGRGFGVVPCARQREVGEDAVNDRGVVDGGDQFHPAATARTAQDVEVKGPAHQRCPRPVAGPSGATAFRFGLSHGFVRGRRRITEATLGDYSRPPAGVRSEDAVVEDLIDRRTWREHR